MIAKIKPGMLIRFNMAMEYISSSVKEWWAKIVVIILGRGSKPHTCEILPLYGSNVKAHFSDNVCADLYMYIHTYTCM